MGKRIKLIYILSLFSALMAISVQAYWLYNQYRYEVERYADEIAADVLRVGDEEFAERRKMAIGDDTSYIIDRSSRTQSGTSTIRNVQTQLCFDFKTDVLVDSIIGGQLNMTKLNLSFDATLPEDSIMMVKNMEDATRTYVANISFGTIGEVAYDAQASADNSALAAATADAPAENLRMRTFPHSEGNVR